MLGDAWFRFRQAVMEAGLYDLLKEQLKAIIENADAIVAKAEEVGHALIQIAEGVRTAWVVLGDIFTELLGGRLIK